MRWNYIKIVFVYIFIAIFILFRMYSDDEVDNSVLVKSDNDIINVSEEVLEVDDTSFYNTKLMDIRNSYGNDDIVGVLSIEGEDFSEIVMQGSDNEYYLRHTVYHDYDWRGQTFLDYRVDINNSRKLIIYGHNSNYYNLPFMIFENYYDKSYYELHKYLYLQTDKGINKYEIFSVYVEVSDWSYYTDMYFVSDLDYLQHLIGLKDKSLYDTSVSVKSSDEVLIIQTCSTLSKYSSYDNSFLLVIGKKI